MRYFEVLLGATIIVGCYCGMLRHYVFIVLDYYCGKPAFCCLVFRCLLGLLFTAVDMYAVVAAS